MSVLARVDNESMTAGLRILVVEDDDTTARLLELQLEQRGYEVLHATSVEAAVTTAQRELPDLITLDVYLRPSGGFEVLDRIRADPRAASIPVVFISIADERKRALEAGAAGYIMKPYWSETLYATLERALGTTAPGDSLGET